MDRIETEVTPTAAAAPHVRVDEFTLPLEAVVPARVRVTISPLVAAEFAARGAGAEAEPVVEAIVAACDALALRAGPDPDPAARLSVRIELERRLLRVRIVLERSTKRAAARAGASLPSPQEEADFARMRIAMSRVGDTRRDDREEILLERALPGRAAPPVESEE